MAQPGTAASPPAAPGGQDGLALGRSSLWLGCVDPQLLAEDMEICCVPGRLRLQPSLWTKDDVIDWLRWAEKEYSLRRTDESKFEMNGKGLCILTKEDFRHRSPSSGDVLYELLQCIKMQRRERSHTPLLSLPVIQVKHMQKISSPTGNGKEVPLNPLYRRSHFSCSAKVCTSSSTRDSVSRLSEEPSKKDKIRDDPSPVQSKAGHSNTDVSTGLARAVDSAPSSHPVAVQSAHNPDPVETSRSPQETCHRVEPLNLSHQSEVTGHREVARSLSISPQAQVDGKIADCKLLWNYVYQLLSDSRYESYIKWEEKEARTFRVVDPNGLAKLWEPPPYDLRKDVEGTEALLQTKHY
uniref:Transcription factor ETV7 isoform X2 n=1 Tax=Geotrypetes seraphini TaxID=260995 RepID=A0A6P8PCU8_GEOSA|nr:transcription factor ETV7 isoform X2 [Geotrypetes seraphini]